MVKSRRQAFESQQLLPSILAGLVIGVLIVNIEISLASLIFSGSLAPYLAAGLGFTLFGAMVIGVVVALTSSYPGAIAMPISNPVPILALMAAAITQRSVANASADAGFASAVTALALTGILSGALLLALGRFKLGGLIRFVPYPVIGGFLAGTGWLLVQGALGTMAGIPFVTAQLPRFVEPDMMVRWVPGVFFGVLLFVVLRRYNHFLMLPGLLVAGTLFFDLFLLVTNTSQAQASARGWLLGSFPAGSLWNPPTPELLARVDWSLVFAQMDKVGSVFVISIIALLLNSTGMELAVRQDINLNRELESAGVANILAGLGGSTVVGYHTQVITILGYRMGASSRLIGLVYGAVCGLAVFFGASLMVYLPKPIPTGLLLYLGLSMLAQWVYDAWFKLTRSDYALILVIMATIVGIGFLEGILTGIVIAIILFVVKYSRIQVVRHTLNGASFHSTMDRPPSQRQILAEQGRSLEIMQLQGFIFFGTAHILLDQIRRRIDAPHSSPLHFLVLDFARTKGLDSSAVSSFLKLTQVAEKNNIQLVFSGLSSEMQCQMDRGGLRQGRIVHWMPTLDAGVEWCEDQILAAGPRVPAAADDLEAQLARLFAECDDLRRLLDYFQKQEVGAGEWLVRQGDPANTLYFIGEGLAAAQLELPDGRTTRLRTMRCGTIIGEVGLYLGGTRTASVRTLQPCVLYSLSADAIRKMEGQDPDLAAALHKWIARLMAERLAENNTALAAMMD